MTRYTKKWPVDVSEMDMRLQKTLPGGTAGQMAALEAVGLVKDEDTEIQGTGFDGKPTGVKFKVKRYTLTDAAKPFAREKDVESIGLNGKTTVKQTDLCWGQKALDKVVKWEGPMKLGDYQEASVTYIYKINNLADWAKKPELQTAFGFRRGEGHHRRRQFEGVETRHQADQPRLGSARTGLRAQ